MVIFFDSLVLFHAYGTEPKKKKIVTSTEAFEKKIFGENEITGLFFLNL